MRARTLALALALFAPACRGASVAPSPAGPQPEQGHEPAPEAFTDTSVVMPDSGFWSRSGPGLWRYDLGVGMVADVQLVAQGTGRGLVHVRLPEGAERAKLTALTVMWAKNHPDMAEAPGAASGAGIWHVHIDLAGQPGRFLGAIPVRVDDARAAPLEDGNDGTRYEPAAPIEVYPDFWLVFQATEGNPRVGAMRLTGDLAETYKDLYYIETPGAKPGAPSPLRPLIALDFAGLGGR